MNKQLGNIYHKLYLLLFALLAFSIPLYDRIAAMAIVLITFTWVIEGKFKQKFNRIKNIRFRLFILSFSLIYLLYLIGFIYSENQFYAFMDLQTKLSLLIFPLLFATIDESILKNNKAKILSYYILGCLVITIILLVHSFYNFLESSFMNEFFYGKLSWYQHASYMAMFLVFAIGILFYQIYTNNEKNDNRKQILYGILIVYFSFFVLMLSSKAGIISLLIIFLSHIGFLIYKKKYIVGVSMLLIYTFALWGSSNYLTVTSSRLTNAQKAITSETIDKNSTESTAERILIFQSALSIIKENFLFGVGTGDANDVLLQNYKTNEYAVAYESQLNAHNQYLQTFIAIGIVGFLVLIGMLSVPFFLALKQQNLIYILLLFLVGFNLLFEAMFERQAGVVFYSFFNGLFFFYMFTEEKSN